MTKTESAVINYVDDVTRINAPVPEVPPISEIGGAGKTEDMLGGAYKDVTRNGGEIHHMAANSVSPYTKNEGPAINMEISDHRQTASWGNLHHATIQSSTKRIN